MFVVLERKQLKVKGYAGLAAGKPRACSEHVFHQFEANIHWIGLRENLQETMVFTIKYRAFL